MIVFPKNRCPSRGLMDPFILVLWMQIWGTQTMYQYILRTIARVLGACGKTTPGGRKVTSGKEKDRFSAQLTVFKDGTKVRVFLIQS